MQISTQFRKGTSLDRQRERVEKEWFCKKGHSWTSAQEPENGQCPYCDAEVA